MIQQSTAEGWSDKKIYDLIYKFLKKLKLRKWWISFMKYLFFKLNLFKLTVRLANLSVENII